MITNLKGGGKSVEAISLQGLVIHRFLLVQGYFSIKCPFQTNKGQSIPTHSVVADEVLLVVNQDQHHPIHVLSSPDPSSQAR